MLTAAKIRDAVATLLGARLQRQAVRRGSASIIHGRQRKVASAVVSLVRPPAYPNDSDIATTWLVESLDGVNLSAIPMA